MTDKETPEPEKETKNVSSYSNDPGVVLDLTEEYETEPDVMVSLLGW